MAEISYRRHRFPAVIIQHAVWLYLRFTLSYRDVEELLAERGLDISYETVRCWVLKFGPVIARRLRRCRPRPRIEPKGIKDTAKRTGGGGREFWIVLPVIGCPADEITQAASWHCRREPQLRLAPDSPLEGTGFEPSVPLTGTVELNSDLDNRRNLSKRIRDRASRLFRA